MPRDIAPRVRERIREAREKVGARMIGQSNPADTEEAQVKIGGGALVSKGKNISQKAINKLEELRPGVLPKVTERLERVKPLKTTGEKVLSEGTTGEGPAGAGETETGSESPAGVGE